MTREKYGECALILGLEGLKKKTDFIIHECETSELMTLQEYFWEWTTEHTVQGESLATRETVPLSFDSEDRTSNSPF